MPVGMSATHMTQRRRRRRNSSPSAMRMAPSTTQMRIVGRRFRPFLVAPAAEPPPFGPARRCSSGAAVTSRGSRGGTVPRTARRRGGWRTISPWPFHGVPAWTAVWTGREMIVWGGFDHQPDRTPIGAAYSPTADRWRQLASFPLRARQWHTAVWTEREMVVWGGDDLVRPSFADGAAYDPRADTWRVLAPAPISGRYRHHAIWAGKEMIVWGGENGPSNLSDGAAYDPTTDSWRSLPPSPLAGRHWASVVWTGQDMIVWGGYNNERAFGGGLQAGGEQVAPPPDRPDQRPMPQLRCLDRRGVHPLGRHRGLRELRPSSSRRSGLQPVIGRALSVSRPKL